MTGPDLVTWATVVGTWALVIGTLAFAYRQTGRLPHQRELEQRK